MIQRGVASATVAGVLFLAACTGGGEDELVEIRETLAEDEGAVEADAPPEPGMEASEVEPEPPDGEEEGGNASAEAPDPPPDDVDITTVPDEITVEYVQAVIDELERILAEALVIMMEEGELTIEVTDRVGEIFTAEQAEPRLGSLLDLHERGFEGMLPPEEIEARERRVEDVIQTSQDCLYIETTTFDDALLIDPTDPIPVFVRLEGPTVERPVRVNTTPWVFASLGVGDPDALREQTPCTE